MKAGMRVVFMGTPDFAVASLKAIVEAGMNVVGVITAPDKPAGRGKKLAASAVKKFALEQQLHLLQPTNLKDPEFLSELKSLQADLQVVVAFRMLPEVVWDMPPKGTINLHGSLLPDYRGAAPINWAVINGEKKSGVTTFFIRKEIDTGSILFKDEVEIGEETDAGELHDKLMVCGANLLVKTIQAIDKGEYQAIEQAELIADQELKTAPKIFKEDCKIDWNQSAQKVYNLIRGLSPYPTAWTELQKDGAEIISLKIFKTRLIESAPSIEPGRFETDFKSFLKVACSDGYIEIQQLQQAGKKRLSVGDFLRGFNNLDEFKTFL